MTASESLRASLAEVLRVAVGDEKRLRARVVGLRIGPVCGRCGGCGRYSFNYTWGTVCFECVGAGTVFPRDRDLAETLDRARAAVAAGDLDRYLENLAAARRSAGARKRVFDAWAEAFSGPTEYYFGDAADFANTREGKGLPGHPGTFRAFVLSNANHIAYRAEVRFSAFDGRFSRLRRKNWLAYEKVLTATLAEVARAGRIAKKFVALPGASR